MSFPIFFFLGGGGKGNEQFSLDNFLLNFLSRPWVDLKFVRGRGGFEKNF